MSKMKRIARYCIVVLSGYACLLVALPLPAYADGGAPNLAYVAGTSQGISIIDIAQQKVTGTFALGGNPRSVYLSLDGRFLYVTQPALNQVSVLAAKTGQLVCTAHVPGSPSLLAYDPQTNTLFVAGNQATSISNINMSNCAVLATIPTNAPVYGLGVVNLASSSANNQLWVSSGTALTIFDTKTRQQLGTVALPGNPRFISTPSGLDVYVSTQQGSLYAVDLSTHHVLPLLSGGQFGAMDFDEGTGEVYVPDSLHQQVDVIVPPGQTSSTAPREPAHVYHFDAAPQSVAITSDGQLGFVALSTGDVVMLDLPGHQPVKTIKVGGDPHFIITGLYPPALGTTPQQASVVETIATIAAYALIAALILIPLWYVARQSRKRGAKTQD
jgi:DNA-binding beta-propeller fold protein YncE